MAALNDPKSGVRGGLDAHNKAVVEKWLPREGGVGGEVLHADVLPGQFLGNSKKSFMVLH